MPIDVTGGDADVYGGIHTHRDAHLHGGAHAHGDAHALRHGDMSEPNRLADA